ncbi:MAG: FtsX-like permease family protein [Salinivirgaceae bacterium]
MIVSIAWKNVWRNKPRSLIVICSITLGTIAGVFVAGLMNGWVDQRIRDVIYTQMSHIKLRNPNYLINEESQYTISDYKQITQFIDSAPEVEAWCSRITIMAMATTSRGSCGIVLKGIDPVKEKLVSNISEKLVAQGGDYFEEPTKLPPVLIGDKTAELLRIKNFKIDQRVLDSLVRLKIPKPITEKLKQLIDIRYITDRKFKSALNERLSSSEIRKYGPYILNLAKYYQPKAKIAFSFTNAKGELSYQTFQVCVIFKTSNSTFDQYSAFVKKVDLAAVAGFGEDQFHEIAILLKNEEEDLIPFSEKLSTQFSEANVMTWKTMAPDAGMMADFINFYYFMIMGIIFFALAFGIINTMMMAILERIKELGMLMAIGMSKMKVFSMIMLETIFLTLVGSVLGMLIGAGLINITGRVGLNFASIAEGFEAIGYSAVVYPSISVSFFFGVTVMVIVIGILSSIIPARKALKQNPVESLRIE